MIQGLNDISLSPILWRAMAELPRGITDRPALVLVKLGNEILARAEDPLAALGLSGRQYLILAVLGADAPPSQLELAGLCGLLPAQVVPVLDELERRGLVARQRSDADRRRSVVRLTPAGEESLAKADELARSIEDTLFGELGAGAREQLHGTLRAALTRTAAD
jgi:DNA-binding MarR family transcriptional regulator